MNAASHLSRQLHAVVKFSAHETLGICDNDSQGAFPLRIAVGKTVGNWEISCDAPGYRKPK